MPKTISHQTKHEIDLTVEGERPASHSLLRLPSPFDVRIESDQPAGTFRLVVKGSFTTTEDRPVLEERVDTHVASNGAQRVEADVASA
jgi:hypothetical protein